MTRNAPARFRWRAFVALTLCFLLAGAFHFWFNWRTFWFHLRSKLAEGLRAKREILAGGVMV